MFLFGSLKLYFYMALAVGAWFLYGWGNMIIQNYSDMQASITRLERDKTLITSRVASYQTLLARRDAAIEASKCKAQIKAWIKDPDTIPNSKNPFDPNSGG